MMRGLAGFDRPGRLRRSQPGVHAGRYDGHCSPISTRPSSLLILQQRPARDGRTREAGFRVHALNGGPLGQAQADLSAPSNWHEDCSICAVFRQDGARATSRRLTAPVRSARGAGKALPVIGRRATCQIAAPVRGYPARSSKHPSLFPTSNSEVFSCRVKLQTTFIRKC